MNNQEFQIIVEQEGNEYEFINEKSGYQCLLRRSPTTGAWCGYVKLPEDHPFHSLLYHDLENMDIEVHGGLTYGEGNGIFGFDCSHYGDYYPMMGMLDPMGDFVTQINDMGEEMGFLPGGKGPDNHGNAVYRTKEYTIDQCNSLAEQFYNYRNAQGN